jgi:putative transposase
VSALTEMYVQGVSTRKVKAVTEELCGHEFSASTISRMNQSLDKELDKFAKRRLEDAYPYLILDARYEKVREGGVIRSQAVMIAIGIGWEGRRCVLAVELANRESASSWKDFAVGLKQRGLTEWNSWSVMTMPDYGPRSERYWQKRHGNAVMCIFCGMRWITYRVRLMTSA